MANAQQLCLLRVANGQKQFSLCKRTKWAHVKPILVPLTHTISNRLSVILGEDMHMFISGIIELFCWEEAITSGQNINIIIFICPVRTMICVILSSLILTCTLSPFPTGQVVASFQFDFNTW